MIEWFSTQRQMFWWCQQVLWNTHTSNGTKYSIRKLVPFLYLKQATEDEYVHAYVSISARCKTPFPRPRPDRSPKYMINRPEEIFLPKVVPLRVNATDLNQKEKRQSNWWHQEATKQTSNPHKVRTCFLQRIRLSWIHMGVSKS